ncbi:transglutaminase-like domain-containing protein [Verrucomicrobiota bacterium sgz303538]
MTEVVAELKQGGSKSDFAKRCFEWVRDNVLHSADCGSDVVSCTASEVVRSRVGLCYAKSHLLVALLRAGGVPAGFSYQRLSLGEAGAFCLHGLVSVFIENLGWYRIDPRGGERGRVAVFTPPVEHLVYAATGDGECDLPEVFAEPLEPVIQAFRTYRSMRDLMRNLPDVATPLGRTSSQQRA